MKYHYSLLREIVESCGAVLICKEPAKVEVTGLRLFTTGSEHRRDLLYVVDHLPAKSESVYAIPKPSGDVGMLYQLLLEYLSSYDDWYLRMLEACTEPRPIQRILQIGTEKFENPIAHFDRFGYLCSHAGEFRNPTEGTIWEPVLQYGYSPKDFYTISEWWDITDAVGHANWPSAMRVKKDPAHYIIGTGIFVNSALVGMLGVTDINAPFTDGQIEILTIIRDVLGRAYAATGEYLDSTLQSALPFERLIGGDHVDMQQISFQLSRLGWKRDGSYRLLYFCPRTALTHRFDSLVQYMISKITKSIFCRVGVCGCLLLPETVFRSIGEDEWSEYYTELERNLVTCIVGSNFRDFSYLRQTFWACQELQEHLLQTDTVTKPLIRYAEYYSSLLSHRLLSAGKKNLLIHPVLVELHESEDIGKQEWLMDLYTFLVYGRNLSRAAEARFAHRSTISYHLEKLSNLLEMDIYHLSEDDFLYLLMSCALLIKG